MYHWLGCTLVVLLGERVMSVTLSRWKRPSESKASSVIACLRCKFSSSWAEMSPCQYNAIWCYVMLCDVIRYYKMLNNNIMQHYVILCNVIKYDVPSNWSSWQLLCLACGPFQKTRPRSCCCFRTVECSRDNAISCGTWSWCTQTEALTLASTPSGWAVEVGQCPQAHPRYSRCARFGEEACTTSHMLSRHGWQLYPLFYQDHRKSLCLITLYNMM